MERKQGHLPTKSLQQPLKGSASATLPAFNSKEALSLTLATAGKGTQLSRLSIDYGETGAAVILCKALNDALHYVPHQLSADLISTYAYRLVTEFWNMKYEDILLVLRKGTGGEYGKHFHTFTWSTLMEWMEKYAKEKEDFLHHAHLNKKHGDCEPIEMNKDSVGAEKFRELRESLKKRVTKHKTTPDAQEADPVKELFKLFDQLHSANGIVRGGIRFVIIEGLEYDQESFVLMKLNEKE